MPIPPPNVIPATSHEESVRRLFAHRLQSVKSTDPPPPPPVQTELLKETEQTIMQKSLEQFLLQRYRYHPPKEDQVPRYEAIRAAVLACAKVLVEKAPPCNELEEALTALDCTMMFANAAIARNG